MRTVVILSLLIVYLILFSLGVSVLRLNFFCRAVCRGKTGGMRVALTFDDGPNPETTPTVLAVLAQYDIKAAFFCVGEKVAQYPEIARRIVDEGHIIANHSYHHFWWTNFLRLKGLGREMAETQEVIKSATGEIPIFFRPPAGLTNPHIDRALSQNGLTCIGWDVRGFDTRRTKEQVVNTIAHKIRDGSIILLHDAARFSQDMKDLLEEVIAVMMRRGLSFSALDDLLGLEPYQEEKKVRDVKGSGGIVHLLAARMAQTGFIRKALAEEITLDAIRKRPTAKFMVGITLVGVSYIIGWPAVVFFTFLAVYLNMKEIVLLGLASYLFSHLVFFAGAALAGVDGIKYGRILMRWSMHRFALWLTKKALPDMGR